MSTQTQYLHIGTGLSNFRSDTIKTFVERSGTVGQLWGIFGRPELVVGTNSNYQCKIQPTGWLDTYNTDGALNDLMNFYTSEEPKHHDVTIQTSILTNSFAFKCNLANTLNIDFSKDFANMIDKLVGIVTKYASLVLDKTSVDVPSPDIYDTIKWIASELLPTLCIWITELHIERAGLPLYSDTILNYIGRVFLLLQAQTYCVQGQKVMKLCEKILASQHDSKERIPGFTQVINGTLATEFDDINSGIKEIVDYVRDEDVTFSDSEKNVTLAAIYDLRYKTDKAFSKDTYFNNNVGDGGLYLNMLTSHYREWLRSVDNDCKLVGDLPKDGSGEEVKDKVCTFFGKKTRVSVTPVIIKSLGKYPVTPVTHVTHVTGQSQSL
jgi:hypothetical protein